MYCRSIQYCILQLHELCFDVLYPYYSNENKFNGIIALIAWILYEIANQSAHKLIYVKFISGCTSVYDNMQ